jgi:hypothetical protein
MGARRRQYRQAQLYSAFAGGGIPGAIAHLKHRFRRWNPMYWVQAARTHPIQSFALAAFLLLWNYTGQMLLAVALTAVVVPGGIALWFDYRRRKTGITYKEAAKRLQMEKRVKARWVAACLATGITANRKTANGTTMVPPLTSIKFDKGDVTARVYTGQYAIGTKKVGAALETIADTVQCREVTMKTVNPGVIDLRFCWANPLEKVVKPANLPLAPKGMIPFGVTDSGEAICIPVINEEGEAVFRSTLVGGVSGSGKSSTLWALLNGFIINDVPVRLRVSDAAGGVELWQLAKAMESQLGTDRFRVIRYAETKAETEAMIKEMAGEMFTRLADMKAKEIRLHKPTVAEPMDILVVDEMLLLKSILKTGADSDLGQMLSICRKAGFGVIACTQLAEKATLGELRELFPMRIAFRMNTRPQTITILGDDQADAGPSHTIPRNAQGVGYMYDQATDSMRKFRSVYITDLMAKQIAQGIAPEGLENYGKEPPKPERMRAVYWHYSYPDPVTGGRTLWYVGSANDPDERFKQHAKDRKSRRWWKKTDHSARRIEWYPTQAEGFAAEWAAIDRDQPLYNDKGNRDNPARLTDEPALEDA